MAGLHIIVVCSIVYRASSDKKRSRFSFNRMIFHIDYVLAFFSDDWNISSDLARDDADELIVCRTNGALEHFNRELNHSFPYAHPSMTEFVTVIRRISQEKAAQYDRVAKRRERSPVHQPVNLFAIPDDYYTFVYHA